MGLFSRFLDPSEKKDIEGQPITNFVDSASFVMERYDGPEKWTIYKMMSEYPPENTFNKQNGFTHGVIAGPSRNHPESTPYFVMLGIRNRKIVKVLKNPQMLF